jgi:hypothetical protein
MMGPNNVRRRVGAPKAFSAECTVRREFRKMSNVEEDVVAQRQTLRRARQPERREATGHEAI